MALIPLNTFKTKTKILEVDTPAIDAVTIAKRTAYTAPVGVTSIVLMAQVSNISTITQHVSLIHYRNIGVPNNAQGTGAQLNNVESFLIKEFNIPVNDSASLLTGKLIIESLDSVRAYASNGGSCQLVLSILETANE